MTRRSAQLACLTLLVMAAALRADDLTWQRMPDMPYGVISGAASLVDHHIVISGGFGQDGLPARLIQVFDLQTNAWKPVARMEVGRSQHAQITLGNQAMIIGGSTAWGYRPAVGTADCVLFDPATMTVKPAAALPDPIASPTAHILSDGRLLVVGGEIACIYDASTDRWNAPILLEKKRNAHASVLLADNRVVVIAGGRSSLELVDPVAASSRLLPCEMPYPMDDLRATRLPDGRVWIVGGQRSDNGDTVDQTWVLDLTRSGQAMLAAGPSLQMTGGVADHVLIEIGPWIVLNGGESQQGGKDIERADSRLLDKRNLAVWSLPYTAVPHDDAMGVAVGNAAVVFSGYRVGASAPGIRPLPIAVREVERLQLPLPPQADGSGR